MDSSLVKGGGNVWRGGFLNTVTLHQGPALGFKVAHSAISVTPIPALREQWAEEGDGPPLNSGYTNSHLHLQTSSCMSTPSQQCAGVRGCLLRPGS